MFAQLNTLYVKTRPAKALTRLISYAFFEGRPLTTKGRWINPLVFLHFRLEKELPQLKKVEKPIFIVGTGRSGTTILGALMSMHRDVGFLNEPKALWHSVFKNEDVVGNYYRGTALYRLDATYVTEGIRRTAHRLYGAYLRTVAAKRVVDKYPELIFRIPFVKEIFPDAKFIFLVRNGWDTCNSIVKWSQRLGVKTDDEVHDWWGVNNRKWRLFVDQLIVPDESLGNIRDVASQFTEHRDMAVVEWIITMREGLLQMEHYTDCVHMVRYEDLTRNPRSTLSQITEFCELAADERLFSYAGKMLSPVPLREAFQIHPSVFPFFGETMLRLGYEMRR